MPAKRYLRVLSTLDPQAGGVVTAVVESVRYHNENRDECFDVVCFDKERKNYHNIGGVDVYNFPSFSSYRISIQFLIWLWNNSRKYDGVIFDGLWQFYILGGYVCRLKNVRFFVFSHGMMDVYFNRFILKYFKKIPFWLLIERNVISLAEGVFYTTEEEVLASINSFPFLKSKNLISPLGIEGPSEKKSKCKEVFLERFPMLKGKEFNLFLSRISKKKGLDILLDLISSDHFLGEFIVIAGPDDNAYADALKKELRAREVDDRVLWTGMLGGDAKWGAFYSAQLFLLPSHQENFGLVVPEALSCGLPVLISNKVNIYRDIVNFKAGIVCDDTIGSLTASFSDWKLKRNNSEEFARNAYFCFNSCYSREVAAQSLADNLRGMI